jgi:hypothetical protein
MTLLAWQPVGSTFQASTRYGTAIIARADGVYVWRVEHRVRGIAMRSDDPDAASPPYCDTFEDAEDFLILSLASLAEPPTEDPDNRGHWLSDHKAGLPGQRASLALGERALSIDTDWAFLARLPLIRAVVFAGDDAKAAPGARPTHQAGEREADEHPKWERAGEEWRADTRFGQAVVAPRQGMYAWRIEHPSGAVLPAGVEGYDPADLAFAAPARAREFVTTQLARLADPPTLDTDDEFLLSRYAEADFPFLAFTLDVCAQSLPPETDPVHGRRLDVLKTDLFLKVD